MPRNPFTAGNKSQRLMSDLRLPKLRSSDREEPLAFFKRPDSVIYLVVNATARPWKHASQSKIFMNNRSQAVRLPKEFQFKTQEVFIRKVGNDVVLSPRPLDWSSYLAEAPIASADFMKDIEDLPVQERDS